MQSFKAPDSGAQASMNSASYLKPIEVVTAFLRHKESILLMRRSAKVGSYQGLWSAVSGYLEDSTPLAQALREVREETGISSNQLQLVSAGLPVEIPAPEIHTLWVVHPFLFELTNFDTIQLDWENTQIRWVSPDEIKNLATVPRLLEALQSCDHQYRNLKEH